MSDLADDPVVRLWLDQGTPLGPVSYQTKAYILREYARHYGLRTLIETGSYDGKTLVLLAAEFDAIHSIELSADFHALCQHKMVEHGITNVHLHLGDSADVLPAVLDLVPPPALIYLDAHFMGPGTALGSAYTPAPAELEAIAGRAGDVVVIDDVEEFDTNPEYPGTGWIAEAAARHLPDHLLCQTGNEYLLLPPHAGARTRPGFTVHELGRA
jgi:hypothetical protein